MAYSADLRNKALNHSGLTKIRTRRRAAGSTNGTEPIRPALHHLREPFPLAGRGNAVPVFVNPLYYGQCKNTGQTAATFNLSRNTLYLRIRLKKQTGSLKHQVTGLNAAKSDRQKPARYVGRHPDACLHEIAKHFDCSRLPCAQTDADGAQKKTAAYKGQDPAKVTHYLTRRIFRLPTRLSG